MPTLPAPSSARGLQANPSSAVRILILSGPFAQHVATVTSRHNHGRVTAEVLYGHARDCAGRTVTLSGTEYVSTVSPTCPALPHSRQKARAQNRAISG